MHKILYKQLVTCSLCLIFFLGSGAASLQSQTINDSLLILKGRLLSEDSLQPLHNAHVISKFNRWGTITDDEGLFKMYVSPGDSVLFTSIGYRAFVLLITDSLCDGISPIALFMEKDTVMINEILIRAFWDYETFKLMVVQMKPINLDPYYPDWEGTGLLYMSATPLTIKGPIQALYDVFNESARLQRKLIRNRKDYNRLMIMMGRPQDTVPAIPEHMQEIRR